MSESKNRYTRFAIIFGVAAAGLGFGLSIPFVTLLLDRWGASATQVGVAAGAAAAGVFLASAYAEKWVARFGYRNTLVWAAIFCALLIAVLGLPINYVSLLVVRFLFGCSFGIVTILGESWINELAGNHHRGRLIAIYTTTYTLFQLVGPSSMASFGVDNADLLYASAVLYLVSAALLCFAVPLYLVETQRQARNVFSIIKKAPDIYAGIFFFALFDITILALLPVYGLLNGYSEQHALLMVSTVFAGDALCQYFIGYAADKKNIVTVYLTCGVLTLLSIVLLILSIQHPMSLWPVLFILGGCAGGIYTLALTLIGAQYKGGDLVTANAGVGILIGLGSIVGPLLGGYLTGINAAGLPYTLLVFGIIFVMITVSQCYRPALEEVP